MNSAILSELGKEAGLEYCNCFAARQAARFVSQLYDRHMSNVALSITQFTLLTVLRQRPGITMVELAQLLVMERTSLVRALKPLFRDGYIGQQPALQAPRKMALSLTELGQAKQRAAYPHWQAAQQEFEQLVGKTRARSLHDELMDITQLN